MVWMRVRMRVMVMVRVNIRFMVTDKVSITLNLRVKHPVHSHFEVEVVLGQCTCVGKDQGFKKKKINVVNMLRARMGVKFRRGSRSDSA